MRHRIRAVALILLAISVSSVTVSASIQTSRDRTATSRGGHTSPPAASKEAARPTPPYHKTAKAAKPFPPLVPASRFRNYPTVARAYEIASEIPGVLAQEPCYCNCDKFFGHTSLLDCFASDHTAGCLICVKESFFTYQMTKQGRKPAEIRKAIIRGDWRNTEVDQLSH